MVASTTHQSKDLTNQPTLAAVASVMPAKFDRICPGLEPSLEDDAVRNFYQTGGLIKPRTLAPTPADMAPYFKLTSLHKADNGGEYLIGYLLFLSEFLVDLGVHSPFTGPCTPHQQNGLCELLNYTLAAMT
eukprot:983067-Pleurochrysis_carterae.AAC.1